MSVSEPPAGQKARKVTRFGPELKQLVGDMIETLHAAPGVGLAAPQVGIGLRIAVVDVSGRDEEGELLVLINPEIVYAEGEIEDEEDAGLSEGRRRPSADRGEHGHGHSPLS